jgi:hypothetical protein
MKVKLFVLMILILVGLTSPSLIYSQEAMVNIAILEFYNESGLAEYDYLSTAIQNSIFTTMDKSVAQNKQTDIKLIPLEIINKASSKYNLNYSTMNNIVNILKFSLETKANIIIFGKFNTDEETDLLTVEIPIYSIAKRDFLVESQYDVEIGEDLFKFINSLSLSTNQIIQDSKDEILVSIEELYQEANPPYHTQKIHFTKLREDFIEVQWTTNKEAVSELYLSSSKDYSQENVMNTYPDETKDALNHTVQIPTTDLPEGEFEYYLIASDTDVLGQTSISDAEQFSRKRIRETARDLFETEKATSIEQALSLANEQLFDDALDELLSIINNGVPFYGTFFDITEDDTKDIYDTIKQVFELELEQTYQTVKSLANQNRFDAAEDYLNTIYDEIVPKYEPYIEIDMERVKEEVSQLKRLIKREEIASVNEEGVDYFPWYLRLSTLHFGFSSGGLDNTPIVVTSGLEAGIRLFQSGFYPFLRFSIPYIMYINKNDYFIQAIIPAIGFRYYTIPTRITYNFGLYMETPFAYNDDESNWVNHIAITVDGGLILNMPLGFYFNAFANFIITDSFDIELGIEGGFNWFLGDEIDPTDVEFDTSLYTLVKGVYLGAKFIHIIPSGSESSDNEYNLTLGCVPVMGDIGLIIKRDLLLYASIGISFVGGELGDSTGSYHIPQQEPIKIISLAPGVEWLINPSNQMLSLFGEIGIDLIYLEKENINNDKSDNNRQKQSTTSRYFPYISINPGVAIQFLFPAGAYFKIGLPILLYPDLNIGIQFNFGIRWYD